MSTIAPAGQPAAGSGHNPELDAAISELAAGAARWAQLPAAARADLMDEIHAATAAIREEWVALAVAAKRIDPASEYVGEEWMSGPYALLTAAIDLSRSLRALAAGRSPLARARVGTAPGGRITPRALPSAAQQSVLLHGMGGEIWLQPGATAEAARASAGLGSARIGGDGGVGLVLGAGNITSIAPLDALYELVAHNRTVMLKLNPTFASLLPVYQQALAPLIRDGYLRIVNGAGDVGGYLAHHPGIAHVHITGSAVTHDAIVWGTGEEAVRRRAANEPQLVKPISSELGGVSPVIVVPGAWTARDLRYQAEHVATIRLHNAGHNCIAGQVVVLSSDWPQREAFLAELRAVLDEAPPRVTWYPGAQQRVGRAAELHPGAEAHGDRVLITEADADLCETEYFAPVLGVVQVPGTGADFLDRAVAFSNAELTGTLGANVIVRPSDRRAMGARFDRAVADLRYGTIAINVWTALGFLSPGAPWGAFPGHTLQDVGSGVGVVHNAMLVADPERVVVHGAFREFPRSVLHGEWSLFPKPPWFVTARSAARTARLLAGWAAKPGWSKLPGIFAAAFRA